MRNLSESVDVVLLAGGRGTRLLSGPGDPPKPLRPVNGRPFLEYLLEKVLRAGAKRAVLSVGFRSEVFVDHFKRYPFPNLEIVFSVEPSPLGTGGGLRHTLPQLSASTALVLNGDSFVDADMEELIQLHRSREAKVTVVLTEIADSSRYGSVEWTREGEVTAFREKGATGRGFINAGVYAIERDVIEEIPAGREISLEREVFPKLLGRGLFAHPGRFPFIDIGTPESYREAEGFFKSRRAP